MAEMMLSRQTLPGMCGPGHVVSVASTIAIRPSGETQERESRVEGGPWLHSQV